MSTPTFIPCSCSGSLSKASHLLSRGVRIKIQVTYLPTSVYITITLNQTCQCLSQVTSCIRISCGTSLVVHWIRIHLPIQGTQVWSLIREDSTCFGATKPVCHKYLVHVWQVVKPVCPTACTLQQKKPPQWEARTLQWGEALTDHWRRPARSNKNPV